MQYSPRLFLIEFVTVVPVLVCVYVCMCVCARKWHLYVSQRNLGRKEVMVTVSVYVSKKHRPHMCGVFWWIEPLLTCCHVQYFRRFRSIRCIRPCT